MSPRITRSVVPGVLCLAALAWFVYLSGLQQNLPYFAHEDETNLVRVTSTMLAQHTLNPGWFGHPRSTLIYPLFFLSNLWQSIAPTDQFLYSQLPSARALYNAGTPYYLLARYITAAYGVLSILLIYRLGKRLFTPATGVAAAFLYIFYPLVVIHTQMARSDSATVFWTLVCLHTLVNLLSRPTAARQLLAGLAIGLAISTKYYLGILGPLLGAVDLLILWRQKGKPVLAKTLLILAGLVAVGVGFALSTPFFFLDFSTAWRDILWEARPEHPAFESFTPLGNFAWYIFRAIPAEISPLQAGLAVIGLILLFYKPRPNRLLLPAFALIHIVTISQSGLHWARWLFPVLPILALLTAFVLTSAGRWGQSKWEWGAGTRRVFVTVAIIAFAWSHIITVGRLDNNRAWPDTRVLAGIWLLQHAPENSFVVYEEYSIPVGQNNFKSRRFWSMAESGYTLDDAYRAGVNFIVVGSYIYDAYLKNPQRFPDESAFYRRLFEQAELAAEFQPSETERGPTIKIYRLVPF